jgi:predicted acyltransferase
LFYWLIDVRGWRKWSYFFVIIGANAIAAYMLSEVWSIGSALSEPVFEDIGHWLPDGPADFIRAVAHVGSLWLILWHFYQRKIFLKV